MNGAYKIRKLVFNYKLYTLHCQKSINLLNIKIEEIERKLIKAKTKKTIARLESKRMSLLAEVKIYESMLSSLNEERRSLEEEIKKLIILYPKDFQILFIEHIINNDNLDAVCRKYDIPKETARNILHKIKKELISF